MRHFTPDEFTQGVNVLMLIDRGVQNSNKGSKRWINKIISTNQDEFHSAAEKLIELQSHIGNPDIRLYSSINPRKMQKAIKLFKHNQIDLNDDNETKFYRRINDSFCSCLMQPECRDRNLFLLDCDSKDTAEVNSFLVTNLGIRMHYQYQTPSGWHFIVEPFNPAICADMKTFEVKKDALMLLNWIDI